WEYDPLANTWDSSRLPIPHAVGGSGHAQMDGHIYIAGGRDAANQTIALVWDYDIAANTWTARANMPAVINVPGSAVVNGNFVIFGGNNPNTTTTTRIYDPGTDTWTVGPALHEARSFVGGTNVGNTAVAVGGFTGPTSSNMTETSTNPPIVPCATATSIPPPSATRTAPPSATRTAPPGATATLPAPSVTAAPTGTVPPSTTPPAATATACPIQFADVPATDPFYPYIRCLVCRGIISGYADNTFRGGNNLTRGQAAKIVSNAAGFSDSVPSSQQSFQDVPLGDPFWVFVERLAGRGYISGYACGAPPAGACVPPANRPYFLTYANITRGQVAKIVANSAGLNAPVPSTQQTFSDVPAGNAFWLYIERLSVLNVISGYQCGVAPAGPCDPQNRPYFLPFNNVTRNQAAKIVANTFFPACQTPAR
ncbi:MAG TPA: S-layer homology domain-containing protein, partial [Chloroflexia bacterium]|nr:S-layer homology domain-containing protein [Chloroflexia bacterium]